MLSDMEDNTFKISVPIITNEELERLNNYLETNLDNIVNEITNHISRDREIILLKKVIEKQSKEIEELNSDLEVFKRALTDVEVVYNKNYTSNDKIKAKIEELDKEEKQKLKGQDRYAIKQEYMYKRSVLQSLLEKE